VGRGGEGIEGGQSEIRSSVEASGGHQADGRVGIVCESLKKILLQFSLVAACPCDGVGPEEAGEEHTIGGVPFGERLRACRDWASGHVAELAGAWRAP